MKRYVLAAAIALSGIAAAEPIERLRDAAACVDVSSTLRFYGDWINDMNDALTGGKITAANYETIMTAGDKLSRELPAKATPGNMLEFCQKIDALYAR